jgi:phosphate transport system protein
MGRYFDENYELLKQKLEEMARRVEETVHQTIDALTRLDAQRAGEIVASDEWLDHREVEIDELIMKLFALQQPMAVDLRFLLSAQKINNDLERMGYQAVNIAQGIAILCGYPKGGSIVDFSHMEAVVLEMVHGCIDAFLSHDLALAKSVCGRDDEVDEMNRRMIHELVAYMREHPDYAECCVSLLLVSRNLERIADLSTNIGEEVIYYIEGRIVKHLHEPA